MWSVAKKWAWQLKREIVALYIAARDPRTPLLAKGIAFAVAAYAASPIDLIPDFIPVLGYLDDLLILPLGILLAIHLIPPNLMIEFRQTAASASRPPVNRFVAIVIVSLWVVVGFGICWWAYRSLI